MATRTDPIWGSPLFVVLQAAGYDGKLGGLEVRWRGVGCGCRRGCRRGGRTLGLDQLGEPAHLTLGGLQTVTLQLAGIEIESLTALGSCRPEGVQAFFQPAAAAFENAKAHIGLGAGKEGEMDVEGVVLPGRRP